MSTDPPRTSSRSRQKSQRALEHEDTKRYLEQQLLQQQQQLDSPAKHPKPRAKSKKTKHRKHDSYCVCKQDKPGPMIECSVCDDWYVGFTLDVFISQRTMQRKSVRLYRTLVQGQTNEWMGKDKYVCPACTLSNPDQHTTSSFPSPSPPPGLELDPAGAGTGMQDKSRSRDGNSKRRKSIPAKRKSKASGNDYDYDHNSGTKLMYSDYRSRRVQAERTRITLEMKTKMNTTTEMKMETTETSSSLGRRLGLGRRFKRFRAIP
nr:hypothetical protein I308_00923 [Cryptococcus tetragattii IND107]